MRQFVGEGMNRKRMIDVGHAAEPSDAHVVIGGAVFRAMVGNIERKIVPAQTHLVVGVLGVRIKGRTDRRIDRALQPCGRLAIRSNRGFHVHGRDRVEVVKVNVVFARPHHLDRLAELLREHRRFGNLIGFRLAPEAAAEQRHVAGNILFLDAQNAGDRVLHGLRILRRSPRQHFSVAIFRHRDRRFHGNVRQVRRVVFRLDNLAALGEGGVHIADIAHNLARLAGKLLRASCGTRRSCSSSAGCCCPIRS